VADGDGRWVVIASKGGAPDHPSWFENLEADPNATIQVKADVIPVGMSVVEGPERERLWGLMTEVWPAYDDYAAKTDRHIPVVLFERR
jgi:deazaflavin-dependent oxidoreductase (nitroreductase family)